MQKADQLVQRVRDRHLTQPRLETAAALGDSGAMHAVAILRGLDSETAGDLPADLSEQGKAAWLRLQVAPLAVDLPFGELEREAAARLALIALEVAQNLWLSEFPQWVELVNQGVVSGAGLAAIERVRPELAVQGAGEACHYWCLADPLARSTEKVAAQAARLRESLVLAETPPEGATVDLWPDWLGKQLLSLLTIALRTCETVLLDSPGDPVKELIDSKGRVPSLVPERSEEAVRVMAEGHRRMVVPWLLGQSDPLQ